MAPLCCRFKRSVTYLDDLLRYCICPRDISTSVLTFYNYTNRRLTLGPKVCNVLFIVQNVLPDKIGVSIELIDTWQNSWGATTAQKRSKQDQRTLSRETAVVNNGRPNLNATSLTSTVNEYSYTPKYKARTLWTSENVPRNDHIIELEDTDHNFGTILHVFLAESWLYRLGIFSNLFSSI